MATVILSTLWIVVLPMIVIDRNPHLRWISVIQAVTTFVIVSTSVVLWVIDVWIVIEAIPVLCGVGTPPLTVKSLLLGIGN